MDQRTQWAVKQQLEALGAPLFEVGVFHDQRGMILRTWTTDQVMRSLQWLRYQNAQGNHIYVRPAASLGTVLLDDVKPPAIATLRRDGLQPAVIVETSPGNYQCWIRLLHNVSHKVICHDLIRSLIASLARQYNADPRCIDWRHFGRLSGFTNPKPRHTRKDGRQPFVLLRHAEPIVCTRGRQHLLQVRRVKPVCPSPAQPDRPPTNHSYAQRRQRILYLNRNQPWAADPDASRLDFMIVCEMLQEGYPPQVVIRELELASPSLGDRKPGHKDDYLHRTLQAGVRALHPFSRPVP